MDDDRGIQWFSPRRRGGLWSATNKRRIQRLEEAGLMSEAGRAVMAAALGSAGASSAFDALADSARQQYLWWVTSAKREATRSVRIVEVVRRLVESAT